MQRFSAFANQQIDSACLDSDKLEATTVNVIVFASRKGGSGKSTLAAHLAAHAHRTSKPCLLIDADPQGSLSLWQRLRGTGEPPIKTADRSVGGAHRRRQARRLRMGLRRHAAEHERGGRGRDPQRDAGRDSGAPRRVRRRRGRGNHRDLPLGAAALRRRRQRRAGQARRRGKPAGHDRPRRPRQIACAGVGRPDHQPRELRARARQG